MQNKKTGLTTQEAQERLLQHGPNLVEEEKKHKLLLFLEKFWAPVPWMLETTITLQFFLGKYEEALIILILLFSNATLSFFQEERSNKAIVLLKKHLAIKSRVLRDSKWKMIPAEDLVPGDIVHLRMGDISPADIQVSDGKISLDQSALTGESLPFECGVGKSSYSGSIVVQGEATGEVTATGEQTYFGKTVSLLQISETKSHIKDIIFKIVRYLVTIDIFFVLLVCGYAIFISHPFTEIIPFVLMLIVASLPVALPATFTLATAIGAQHLTKRGVLVTRLSAIEEAATMDILCLDKTGTITQNSLELATVKPFASFQEERLLELAALASQEETQDPIDKAILEAAQLNNFLNSKSEIIEFIPFDPSLKRTEATFKEKGHKYRVLKGAPLVISKLTEKKPNLKKEISQLAAKGYRILAVGVTGANKKSLELAGLLAFYDPPREDSKTILKTLKKLGLRILMITGDGIQTAKTIAAEVGIGKRVCSSDIIHKNKGHALLDCDVFAGVFPEDKFQLVRDFQKLGHTVGMTGDGVNDAPALKQAEVGIAVANAMDVAKSSASIVLTEPGLSGILSAIRTSRRIYRRMLTYTLNKVMKSLEIIVFLSLGFILADDLILTPLLMVILLFTNDFATMAIATDNALASPKPARWKIDKLMMAGGALAFLVLIFSFSVFLVGKDILLLPLPELQTLVFLTLVFTGQGNIYLVRERNHFWNSRPSNWLFFITIADILIISLMATFGVLLTPISPLIILILFMCTAFYLFIIDFLKIQVFTFLNF
ncbi:MAG: plasma-membrane proton-efflux P-type ATPase [Alphaproteobacteria bacterium]|nr:plasma-membrane proton-efflux P-type ATPase [Alphaproteobacteria bacterium]